MEKNAIKITEEYVKNFLSGEGSGHDWWHIARVRNLALFLGKKENNVDIEIIELAALLHDIADRKLNNGDTKKGMQKVKDFLSSTPVNKKVVTQVCEIIETMSFSSSFLNNGKRRVMKTLEGKIVQDADRLDAIGAIGIARTFAYGGSKGSEMYNPNRKPTMLTTKKQYTRQVSHTINHFYEKLFLLKDLMNTSEAKKIAQKRHNYMKQFLKEFMEEWGSIN